MANCCFQNILLSLSVANTDRMQVRHHDLLRDRLTLLMDKHEIADVVFIVGTQRREFPCHRTVFAAQSKVRPPGGGYL